MPARTTPQGVTSQKMVLILTIPGMSQFQTTQVWGNAYMHKICCRTVLATCGVLLSLERSGSVARPCMGLIERKHGTFFLLRAKPAPPCPSTDTVLPPVANTTALSYTSFTACLVRRAWKYTAPLLSFRISHCGT
jgi:hypothetical protein